LASFLCDFTAAFSPNFQFLLLNRLVFGFNLGIIYPTIAAFLTEITPINLRGKTFGIISLSFTLGELYSCILGYFLLKNKPEENWRLLFAFSCLPTFICFILSFLFLKVTLTKDTI
jgi:putative MFS transporter